MNDEVRDDIKRVIRLATENGRKQGYRDAMAFMDRHEKKALVWGMLIGAIIGFSMGVIL